MTRDEALKIRAAAFDAGLQVRRLHNKLSNREAEEKKLREEYSNAQQRHSQLRKEADAAEAEAILEEARTADLVETVDAIKR